MEGGERVGGLCGVCGVEGWKEIVGVWFGWLGVAGE